MKEFMDKDFLLETETAKHLFHDYAEHLPLVDYHCHIPPKDVYEDVRFDNLAEVWLGGENPDGSYFGDHYKWRLMRSNGVSENDITGDADNKVRIRKFAEALELAIGNPMYHWSNLELHKFFGVEEPLTPENSDRIYDLCAEKLRNDPNMSVRGLIKQSNVAFIGTTDDPIDSLEWHKKIAADPTITFNEAYRQMLKEMYPDFDTQTRVLYSKSFKTRVNVARGSRKVTREPFIVYISGIDVYGDIAQTSRSDVNILASVNPLTHRVQLISTPRDSYVELPSYGDYDKLTHAGIYGVSESIRALEELYGIEVDYYVRVNFTGFEEIVDALGGITVYSEEGFTAWDGTWFDEGENNLNGAEALSFARERKAFSDGDIQRGRNQMKVIKAIAEKAMSPAILSNYSAVMDAAGGSIETSMTQAEIGALAKMQLSSSEDWNIESYAVTGYVDSRTTYSYGASPLSVVIPEESSIAEARLLLQENQRK